METQEAWPPEPVPRHPRKVRPGFLVALLLLLVGGGLVLWRDPAIGHSAVARVQFARFERSGAGLDELASKYGGRWTAELGDYGRVTVTYRCGERQVIRQTYEVRELLTEAGEHFEGLDVQLSLAFGDESPQPPTKPYIRDVDRPIYLEAMAKEDAALAPDG